MRVQDPQRPNKIRHIDVSDLRLKPFPDADFRLAHRALVKAQVVILRARDMSGLLSESEKDLLTDISYLIYSLYY